MSQNQVQRGPERGNLEGKQLQRGKEAVKAGSLISLRGAEGGHETE